MQPLQLRTLRVQPTIQPQPRMQQVPSSARIVSNATAEAAPLPSRPKPPPGVFAFARLSFLDKRVSQCYGCGKTLKEGGNIPYPPDDLESQPCYTVNIMTKKANTIYHPKFRQFTFTSTPIVYAPPVQDLIWHHALFLVIWFRFSSCNTPAH